MGELKMPTANSAQIRTKRKRIIKITMNFDFLFGSLRKVNSKINPNEKSRIKAKTKSNTDQLKAALPSSCSTKGMMSIRTVIKRIIFCILLNLPQNRILST